MYGERQGRQVPTRPERRTEERTVSPNYSTITYEALGAVQDLGAEYDSVIPHKLYPPEGVEVTVKWEAK